jgi:hypothetical protein
METIDIEGFQFDTIGEALQHVDASGRGVVGGVYGIDGYLVVERAMADKLDEARLLRAYFYDHIMPDGTSRVMSVPVGD